MTRYVKLGIPRPTSKDDYYPYFDYLRALAAAGVFLSHADTYHIFPSDLGTDCVQVFFALSGFLIGGILLRSKPINLPRFYFNRSTRIWIPYAIAVLLVAVATEIKQGFSEPKFSEFFFYMVTFVYNWFGPPQLEHFVHQMPLDGTANHFWSICVEEQFYLVAPFVILFLHRSILPATLLVASLLSPFYFFAISLGVLLALIGPRWGFLLFSTGIGIIAAIFWTTSFAVPVLSVSIVGLLAIRGRQNRIGKIAGGASYPFYLNHWIALFGMSALAKFHVPYWLSLPSGFVAASAIGCGHYLLIDKFIAERREQWFSVRLGVALCSVGLLLVMIGLLGGFVILPLFLNHSQ